MRPDRSRPAGASGRDWASKAANEARLSPCSPAFAACVRPIPEIPALVIDAHGRDFSRRKRDFLVTADLYNATLTRDDLIESSAVPKFYGNYLVAYACLLSLFQVIGKHTRNCD